MTDVYDPNPEADKLLASDSSTRDIVCALLLKVNELNVAYEKMRHDNNEYIESLHLLKAKLYNP